MSAYGQISKPHTESDAVLSPTKWELVNSTGEHLLTVYHLTLQTARAHAGLVEYLHGIFAKEVEDGMTYPQEGDMGQAAFEGYFFSADVFIAVLGLEGRDDVLAGAAAGGNHGGSAGVEEARAGRPWEECVVGYYYVKPNYPGRSSHICNAGFVVPPAHRACGYGTVLGKSYIHYAPKLGYRASVFNLVFVNNVASAKLWEKLGFTKAGLIPRAGRLKRKDGQGEEYVDAWMFYKSFTDDDVESRNA